MNCHKIKSLMSAYVDSELPGVEMLSFRRHISECPACREEYESILQVKRTVAAFAPAYPSAYLAERICARLDRTPEQRPILERIFGPTQYKLKIATAGAALLALGTFLVPGGPEGVQVSYIPTAQHIQVRMPDEDPFKALNVGISADSTIAVHESDTGLDSHLTNFLVPASLGY
ncbi:MAG: anti-sigma factor family protein [Armatimonadota bacterium]